MTGRAGARLNQRPARAGIVSGMLPQGGAAASRVQSSDTLDDTRRAGSASVESVSSSRTWNG